MRWLRNVGGVGGQESLFGSALAAGDFDATVPTTRSVGGLCPT